MSLLFVPRAFIFEYPYQAEFYTAPSALRGLMRMDDAFFAAFELERLRAIFSVGEPLSEAVYEWGRRVLGRTI